MVPMVPMPPSSQLEEDVEEEGDPEGEEEAQGFKSYTGRGDSPVSFGVFMSTPPTPTPTRPHAHTPTRPLKPSTSTGIPVQSPPIIRIARGPGWWSRLV